MALVTSDVEFMAGRRFVTIYAVPARAFNSFVTLMAPDTRMTPLQRDRMRLACVEVDCRPLFSVTCGIGTKRSVVGPELDVDMTFRTTVIGQKSMFMNKVRAEVARGLRQR